jgi:transposase-like protein
MAVFAGAALVRLVCPHCGEVQARARKKKTERYACRRCHRRFTLTEGSRKRRR